MINTNYKVLDDTTKQTIANVVDFNLVFSAILGVLIYASTFPKINSTELLVQFVINGLLVSLIVLMAIFRTRIQTTIKAHTVLILLFIVTYSDLLLYGILSANKVFFIAIPVFASMVFELKKTIRIYIISNLLFSIIAYLTIFNKNPFLQDVYNQSYDPLTWFINYLELLIIGTGVLVLFHEYGKSLIKAYGALNDHKNKLEKIVDQRTKQLQETNIELRNAISTKDKFFSIIGHDMKSPMRQLIQLVDLLKIKYKNTEEPEEGLNKIFDDISDSSYRNVKLLENLLLWAMSQSGDLEFNPEKIQVKSSIKKVILLLEQTAKHKNIEISNAINSDLEIIGDINMIETIFRNLISNGIKFTNDNGKLTISAIVKSDIVEICIQDTGIGMDESTKNKLFKIDEKTSITGTNGEKGTGLGLLICKDFVERHEGEIWVESEEGVGSQFKFTIPLKRNMLKK